MPGDDVSHETMHVSLLCRVQAGNPHTPCIGTCDGHGTGESCDRPCQCACHHVSHETMPSAEAITDAYREWARKASEESSELPYPGDGFRAGVEWAMTLAGLKTDVSHETVEARIKRYRQAREDRNRLVKEMVDHGWSISNISRALDIGRATIYRILGKDYAYNHGKEQRTQVRREEGSGST